MAPPVSGCLFLAAFVDGKTVTTIEHLAADGKLSPSAGGFPGNRRDAVRILHA